jgi:hypothetical protein
LRLREAGRRALSLEFGLPTVPEIGYVQMGELNEADSFYLSPAFKSLIARGAAHPRKIRTLFGEGYLGLWPLAAPGGHRVETTDENIALACDVYLGLLRFSATGQDWNRPVLGKNAFKALPDFEHTLQLPSMISRRIIVAHFLNSANPRFPFLKSVVVGFGQQASVARRSGHGRSRHHQPVSAPLPLSEFHHDIPA